MVRLEQDRDLADIVALGYWARDFGYSTSQLSAMQRVHYETLARMSLLAYRHEVSKPNGAG